jgi:hypothetical protein
MNVSTSNRSREVYLHGLRLLWSPLPVDLAFARGQINVDEHQSIVQAIAKKHQVRNKTALPLTVNDALGRKVAEITQRRDGTYLVRALLEPMLEPVVCTSEEQCYRWIENIHRG